MHCSFLATERFWMVNRPGTPSQAAHRLRDDAVNEARRLAAAMPGKRFFVLEAVASFQAVDVIETQCTENPPSF